MDTPYCSILQMLIHSYFILLILSCVVYVTFVHKSSSYCICSGLTRKNQIGAGFAGAWRQLKGPFNEVQESVN